MSTYDFRASQVKTSKIIASGSTGTNAEILVYSTNADGVPAGEGNINTDLFATSSIGTDVFLYVSGSNEKKSVFGGDVVVSGSLYSNGLAPQTGTKISVNLSTNGALVVGTGDGGDGVTSTPRQAIVRAPNWASGLGMMNKDGISLIFEGGKGTGTGIPSQAIFRLPKTVGVPFNPQTTFDILKLYGQGHMQLIGGPTSDRPAASSDLSGSFWYHTDTGALSYVAKATWQTIPTGSVDLSSYARFDTAQTFTDLQTFSKGSSTWGIPIPVAAFRHNNGGGSAWQGVAVRLEVKNDGSPARPYGYVVARAYGSGNDANNNFVEIRPAFSAGDPPVGLRARCNVASAIWGAELLLAESGGSPTLQPCRESGTGDVDFVITSLGTGVVKLPKVALANIQSTDYLRSMNYVSGTMAIATDTPNGPLPAWSSAGCLVFGDGSKTIDLSLGTVSNTGLVVGTVTKNAFTGSIGNTAALSDQSVLTLNWGMDTDCAITFRVKHTKTGGSAGDQVCRFTIGLAGGVTQTWPLVVDQSGNITMESGWPGTPVGHPSASPINTTWVRVKINGTNVCVYFSPTSTFGGPMYQEIGTQLKNNVTTVYVKWIKFAAQQVTAGSNASNTVIIDNVVIKPL